MSETTASQPDYSGKQVKTDSPPSPGSVVFKYGYVPCIVFETLDGKIEVAEFANLDWDDPDNYFTERLPRPSVSLPTPPAQADRMAELERQVAALTTALTSAQGDKAAAPDTTADPAASEPFASTPGESA